MAAGSMMTAATSSASASDSASTSFHRHTVTEAEACGSWPPVAGTLPVWPGTPTCTGSSQP